MSNYLKFTGSCCCGEIRYSIKDLPLFTHACHCKDCKKSTGSAFVIHTIILESSFFIEFNLKAYELSIY